MSKYPILSAEDVVKALGQGSHSGRQKYRAMFSTWWGGILRDPNFMMVPVDDHMVHRGDAVFEAMKCVDRKIFALDQHLERLVRSAQCLSLNLPMALNEIRQVAIETTRVSEADSCLLRLFVSRGPGGFTANPYECIGSQLYLIITDFQPVSNRSYEEGVSVMLSQLACKDGFYATVKSCNYLTNVLMKKESVDRGVSFTVGRDSRGYLTESATENFAIVSKTNELWLPSFEHTLRGITATRVMELGKILIERGVLSDIKNHDIAIDDVRNCREAMMLGTTLDVLPVTQFEGERIGSGTVGEISKALHDLLRQDMCDGPWVTHL